MLQGDYRGLVPGPRLRARARRASTSPGDDVRRIDWNVTARMRDPYVRETIADRELETWVVRRPVGQPRASAPPSARSATSRSPPLAAVGFLTQRTGNRIGGLLVEAGAAIDRPGPHRTDPPPGPPAPRGASPPASTSRASRDLAVASDGWRRSCAAAAWSWWCPTSSARPPGSSRCGRSAPATRCCASRSSIPASSSCPTSACVHLEDPETGAVREVQTARRRHPCSGSPKPPPPNATAIGRDIRGAGADHLVLRTDHDWLLDLVRFVSWRRERVDALVEGPAMNSSRIPTASAS